MSKLIDVIYSQQADGFVEGRAYSNPRFFSTPRTGVSKVFLVGDWPAIRAAYEALGVPVERIDMPIEPPKPTPLPEALAPAQNPAGVTIPADWRDLKWSKPNADGLTLRGLAASVSAVPVTNGKAAVEAIEAEIARRLVDAPIEVVDGLTRRELNADFAALGLEIDPTMDPADMLELRDMARAERDEAGE